MGKKIALFVAVSIFLGSVLSGNEVEVLEPEKVKTEEKKGLVVPKDPLIAGLLSVQYPGLGQVYCRHYLRGVGYFVGEIGCYILAASLAGLEQREYTWTAINEKTGEERKLTTTETISKWDELGGAERAGVIGLILGGIGVHIWNVIDAYHLAQKHNQERLGWIRDVDVQLGFKDASPSLKVAVSKKF